MESVIKRPCNLEGLTHRINKMKQRLPLEYYTDIKRNENVYPKYRQIFKIVLRTNKIMSTA